MLFPHQPRQKRRHQNGGVEKVIIIKKQTSFKRKPDLKKLDLLCPCRKVHQLPVRLRFLSTSRSNQGEFMAVYCCSFPGCRWREGWVTQNGKPKKLFGAIHDGR